MSIDVHMMTLVLHPLMPAGGQVSTGRCAAVCSVVPACAQQCCCLLRHAFLDVPGTPFWRRSNQTWACQLWSTPCGVPVTHIRPSFVLSGMQIHEREAQLADLAAEHQGLQDRYNLDVTALQGALEKARLRARQLEQRCALANHQAAQHG